MSKSELVPFSKFCESVHCGQSSTRFGSASCCAFTSSGSASLIPHLPHLPKYGLYRRPVERCSSNGQTAHGNRTLMLTLIMVACRTVIQPSFHAAFLESDAPNRTGKDRFCRAFHKAPYHHAPRGKPCLTLDSDGYPLQRLLLGS